MAVDPQVARTNASIRTGARVLGAVLLVVGLVVFLHSGAQVVHAINRSDDMGDPDFGEGPPFGTVLATMGGFLLIGVSLVVLNVGFLRTQAGYAAGEAGAALRSVARDLAEGAQDAGRSGPYCPSCGVRSDSGDRFCSACGGALPTS
jgi:hypothetical protein